MLLYLHRPAVLLIIASPTAEIDARARSVERASGRVERADSQMKGITRREPVAHSASRSA